MKEETIPLNFMPIRVTCCSVPISYSIRLTTNSSELTGHRKYKHANQPPTSQDAPEQQTRIHMYHSALIHRVHRVHRVHHVRRLTPSPNTWTVKDERAGQEDELAGRNCWPCCLYRHLALHLLEDIRWRLETGDWRHPLETLAGRCVACYATWIVPNLEMSCLAIQVYIYESDKSIPSVSLLSYVISSRVFLPS